ncbi:MAG: FkbM family methyltransferase [Patescibacteria group bacterium]|nr:FkbM family methyltransferase [Patescibacteria group bacterium]MDD4304268.1 FkbM family methyltransferase [Patescibacteria group bacterium]MDD4695322.1 FkbM family methyltransferase [Patescibacteria group bacterium]
MNKISNRIIEKIKFAHNISANRVEFIKILFVISFFSLKKKISLLPQIRVKLCLKFVDGYDIKYFNFYPMSNCDFAIFDEIFINKEYKFDSKNVANIIFDIGSNVGLSVIYFKLKFPQAIIYCFEPDKKVFDFLKLNTSQFKDVICENMAITKSTGKIKFYPYPNSSMSSSMIQRLKNQNFIEVNSFSIDDYMFKNNIDFVDILKFDVEGAEFEIFQNIKSINSICEIIGEFHADLTGKSINDFMALFDKSRNISLREIRKEQRYIILIQ